MASPTELEERIEKARARLYTALRAVDRARLEALQARCDLDDLQDAQKAEQQESGK